MGLSDLLQKAIGAIAIVIFIFDVIAIGTGLRYGTQLQESQGGGFGVYIGIPVMMLLVGLVYTALAVLSGLVGVAKNITLPATGIAGLIFSLFTWMQVGLLAVLGSSTSPAEIIGIGKASLAFSILVGILLLLSTSFFFFMKEETSINLGNEGHDYADLDH